MEVGSGNKCCGCIQPNIGLSILGVLYILSLIDGCTKTYMMVKEDQILPAALSMIFVVLFLWVVFYYLRWWCNDSVQNRQGLSKA